MEDMWMYKPASFRSPFVSIVCIEHSICCHAGGGIGAAIDSNIPGSPRFFDSLRLHMDSCGVPQRAHRYSLGGKRIYLWWHESSTTKSSEHSSEFKVEANASLCRIQGSNSQSNVHMLPRIGYRCICSEFVDASELVTRERTPSIATARNILRIVLGLFHSRDVRGVLHDNTAHVRFQRVERARSTEPAQTNNHNRSSAHAGSALGPAPRGISLDNIQQRQRLLLSLVSVERLKFQQILPLVPASMAV